MRIICLTLSLVAVTLFPAVALAKNVPPGNSAADQYKETLPSTGGNDPTNPGGGESPSSSHQLLSPAAQRSLDKLGPAGRATANLANSTAAGSARKGHSTANSGQPSGSSGLLDVVKQVGGSHDDGGMGILLPLILAGSAVAALGLLLARRRRRFGPTEPSAN